MSGVFETKEDEDVELMRLRASAELLEQQVAERIRVAKNEAEKKLLEERINGLKRKLETIDGEVGSQGADSWTKETGTRRQANRARERRNIRM